MQLYIMIPQIHQYLNDSDPLGCSFERNGVRGASSSEKSTRAASKAFERSNQKKPPSTNHRIKSSIKKIRVKQTLLMYQPILRDVSLSKRAAVLYIFHPNLHIAIGGPRKFIADGPFGSKWCDAEEPLSVARAGNPSRLDAHEEGVAEDEHRCDEVEVPVGLTKGVATA